MTKSQIRVFASLAAFGVVLGDPALSYAQMDLGPKVEKTYGEGLPRDRDRLIFADDQYPVWPLTPEQKRVRQHRWRADEAARHRPRADRPPLSRCRPQVVGPSARHHRRPRRHGVHDARVRGPRAQGRALPVCASRGLAADGLGRELQDGGRNDDRTDDRVPRRRHQGHRASGASRRKRSGWASALGPISSAGMSRARRSSSTARSFLEGAAIRPAIAPASSTPTPGPSNWARRWW